MFCCQTKLQIGSKNRTQVVEERIGDHPSADQTYIWGARFVDDLICRNESGIRIFALQDANFNVVALVEEFGTLLERFHYDLMLLRSRDEKALR